MPNPTVPRRANQIPRSLPAGVGGGDGFGHHPKPVLPGPETPADFPMRQRRYRGPGGGDYQWDSKTETPVWREVPRDKNLPKRQYSPAPREQFPNSYKKSRYKPGTLRIPTQNPPEKPVLRPVKKPSDWIKKGVKGGIIDFFKDEALKPSGGSDGTIPGNAFPGAPPRPQWTRPTNPSRVCGQKLDRVKWTAKKGDRLEVFEYGVYLNQAYGGVIDVANFKEPDIAIFQKAKINGKWVNGYPWKDEKVENHIEGRVTIKYKYYDYILREEVEGKIWGWVYFITRRPKTWISSLGQWVYGEDFKAVHVRRNGKGDGMPPKSGNVSDYSGNPIWASFPPVWNAQDDTDKEEQDKLTDWVKSYVFYGNKFATFGLICQVTDFDDGEDGENYEPDDDYDFDVDEDTEMGCKWQKDEVSYNLPELRIGDTKVGGGSIQIDDGLIPFADYMCKSIEIMFKGLGLDHLDTEMPALVTDRGGTKVKHQSLAEVVQWQFENVSHLVGVPVKNTITNLDNDTKDLTFKNIQDCLSYLVHQQRESDLDLMVIENYTSKIAQQLEAVTQICLRQESDIEMLVKELGFKFKWETRSRKSLYKIGMSDEDEKTGILELFKGGEVSYPVRIWADQYDQRQIAMRTNLYSEISAKSSLQSINTENQIPGLDARIKMNKTSDEDWREFVKSVNIPEKGTVSGVPTPYIEEYNKGSLEAKNIPAPISGLSLFMKPKKGKTK